MDEYNKLFDNFAQMGVDEKRNAINEEIMKISYLLKNGLNYYNQDSISEPYNYKKNIDKDLSESEVLNLCFKDIYYIKSEILLLMSIIDKK